MTSCLAQVSERRQAREEALGLLYEIEITGDALPTALAAKLMPPQDYALQLAQGVVSCCEKLDKHLATHLVDWTVDRLAVIDKLLARLATWELLEQSDVPTGVVLSEAVDLASQYCGAESVRFLNGLLRAVAIDVRGLQE